MANGQVTEALRFSSYRRVFGLQVTVGVAKYAAQGGLGAAIYCTFDSAALLGVQAAVALTSAAVAIPVAGWLTTKFSHKAVIRANLLFLALVLTVAGFCSYFGVASSWLLIVVAGLIAAGAACVIASLQELETASVPRDVRQSAISMASLASGIPRVLGLVLGALIGVTFPAYVCFGFVVGIVLLALMLPLGPESYRKSQSVRECPTPLHDVAVGFKAGIGDRRFRSMLLALFIAMVALLPIESEVPAILGTCSSTLALYVAALAIGGIAGGPVVGRLVKWNQSTILRVGVVFAVASFGLLALSSGDLWAVVPMFFLGLAWELIWCSVRSAVQLESSDVSGQAILRLMTIACCLVPAVGSLILGFVVESASAEIGLLLSAVILLSCFVLRRPSSGAEMQALALPAPRGEPEQVRPLSA